jgi:4-amino-4-deoxychorismate lyase
MCLLIETIRIEEGKFQNISFHNERFNRSRGSLLGIDLEIDLEKFIAIPPLLPGNSYKCRIIYSSEIVDISFSEYAIKKLTTIQMVEDNSIEYAYKFHDRKYIEKLKENSNADDILIIKNGFITDVSYANIVFWDGNKWITPATPLLCGTMRSKLLHENKIQQEEIRKSDIKLFKSAKIINAMIGLEESPLINISNIF